MNPMSDRLDHGRNGGFRNNICKEFTVVVKFNCHAIFLVNIILKPGSKRLMTIICYSKVVTHIRHGDANWQTDPFLQFQPSQAFQPDRAVLDGEYALGIYALGFEIFQNSQGQIRSRQVRAEDHGNDIRLLDNW